MEKNDLQTPQVEEPSPDLVFCGNIFQKPCKIKSFCLPFLASSGSDYSFEAIPRKRVASDLSAANDTGEPPVSHGMPVERVQRGRPLRFFIGGLTQEVDEKEIHEAFSKYGNVVAVRVAKDYATGRKRGFGFVTMEEGTSTNAIFNRVQYIGGKRVDIRRENDTTSTDFPRKVFVGGLHPSWDAKTLITELSRFGEVEAVQIATDWNKRSRCFGFVTFKQERVAESLIGQGSCRIADRFVEIRRPEPKRSRAQMDCWRIARQGCPNPHNLHLWYYYSQQQWPAYYGNVQSSLSAPTEWQSWPAPQGYNPLDSYAYHEASSQFETTAYQYPPSLSSVSSQPVMQPTGCSSPQQPSKIEEIETRGPHEEVTTSKTVDSVSQLQSVEDPQENGTLIGQAAQLVVG